MSDVTLEHVLELAEQLTPTERAQLVERLQATLTAYAGSITREAILAEHARLKAAGAFSKVESLRNKYARPDLDLSFDAINADLHEFSTEWEKEFDEFLADE